MLLFAFNKNANLQISECDYKKILGTSKFFYKLWNGPNQLHLKDNNGQQKNKNTHIQTSLEDMINKSASLKKDSNPSPSISQ